MKNEQAKVYRVVASGNEEAGELLTNFTFPWKDCRAPSTKFRARWTREDQRLHFAFDVEDDDIVLAAGEDSKTQVIGSDRVELFFSCDEDLSQYYALEMDPRGVVLDYAAKFHREMDWEWAIDDLELETDMRKDGYSVSGSLSLHELEVLGCIHKDEDGSRYLIAGAFRAEFHRDSTGKVIEDWIAWIDPEVATPDFHVPSSFGRFLLAE